MATPTDHTPAPAARPPAATLHRWFARLEWAIVRLFGSALALTVAGALAAWFWAATPGSVAQSLGWAQS